MSLAAPGAGAGGCELGVFSILPAAAETAWDDPRSCSRLFSQGGARFAYGQGTSFAAPLVAGIAALTWQVESRLASEQVADVLIRSARQTVGTGWNERTGAGVVDGGAATALARIYDVTPPPKRGQRSAARRHARCGARRARDRPHARQPRAGRAPDLHRAGVTRRRPVLPRGRSGGGSRLRRSCASRAASSTPLRPPSVTVTPTARQAAGQVPPPLGAGRRRHARLQVAHRVHRRPVDRGSRSAGGRPKQWPVQPTAPITWPWLHAPAPLDVPKLDWWP